MNFKEAYEKMQEGKKVRRKDWLGYWFIEDGKVKIYLKDGNIKFNNFTQETIANTLVEDWEVVEEPKSKDWKPKKGDKYYYISNTGFIFHCAYNEDNEEFIDKANISMGNCFKTEEEAKHIVEKLKVIHELQKFAYENNEKEIDWNGSKQYKYYLVYDTEDEELYVDYAVYCKREPLNIYFTSSDIARKALKTIGENRIKKYYFDIDIEE